jgi:hypothetical protein
MKIYFTQIVYVDNSEGDQTIVSKNIPKNSHNAPHMNGRITIEELEIESTLRDIIYARPVIFTDFIKWYQAEIEPTDPFYPLYKKATTKYLQDFLKKNYPDQHLYIFESSISLTLELQS